MNKINIMEVERMEFPSGRNTRVLLGDNGAIKGDFFCQGYVTIYPNGSIPIHEHETVESYTILKGQAEITVENEVLPIGEGELVYIEAGKKHGLINKSKEDVQMMFVYAPKMIAEHWEQEKKGLL